jgi:hypothetical protein
LRSGVTVGGNYRGTTYTALGRGSEEDNHATHEFGVSLTWDPNK